MFKATLKGLTLLAMVFALNAPAWAGALGASGLETSTAARLYLASNDQFVQVQSYSQSGSANLVPPSVAIRSALRYSKANKALGIRLKRNVYIVKVKKSGQIRRVRVDARNGRVIGY